MVQRASPLCAGSRAHVALRAQPASRRPSPHRPRASRAGGGAAAGTPRRARGIVRVIFHRCFAWDRSIATGAEGGALWFARAYQGDGRHDNPDAYGCLYLAEQAVSAVVEQLARFRGSVLVPQVLVRRGLPLALATIELAGRLRIVDLDDPAVLAAHALPPSRVATRRRDLTQPQALGLYRRGAAGIRWWSTFESLWTNVTVVDRLADRPRVGEGSRLGVDDSPRSGAV